MRKMMVVVIALTMSRAAQAQGTRTQAEEMFLQGRKLLAAGKIAEACAAFDLSEKLVPTHETMLNQANCREKNGEIATAWRLFVEAEHQTRSTTNEASKAMNTKSAEQAAKLWLRLSTLRVSVPAATRVLGLEIIRDGLAIDPATWDLVLPIDGGSYHITARAPGHAEWSCTITIGAERDAKTLEIPKLEVLEVARAVSSGDRSAALRATAASTDSGSLWSTKRRLAIGVAGGGAVALSIGTFLGVSAKNAQSGALALCPDPQIPCHNSARATELTTTGHNRAIAADVTLGIGAAGMIAACVMWFTGAPEMPGRVAVMPSASIGQFAVIASRKF